MMIANASGNAARSAVPPSTSHVSLPSHTGATVFIIRLRSSSLAAVTDSTPTPRSKPSSSTYMNTPTPMISVQIGTRSICIASPSALGRGQRPRRTFGEGGVVRRNIGRRPLPHQVHHVVGAGAENDKVDDDVADQRDDDVAAGERWRHRVARAQQSVDNPRLAPDLGNGPACEHREKAGGQHRDAGSLEHA